MSHELGQQRDKYALWWVCSCGWSIQFRDKYGQLIPGVTRMAINHTRENS